MTQVDHQLVSGRVTRHVSYGFYVEIGLATEGLVVVPMIDEAHVRNPVFPPVGSVVTAAVLGCTAIGGQPRLSTRPSDLWRGEHSP